MEVLDKILELIRGRQMTDKEFEQELGLPPKTVSDWRRGRSKSYLKHIGKIAKFFGVSADSLFGLPQPGAQDRSFVLMGRSGGKQKRIDLSQSEYEAVLAVLETLRSAAPTAGSRTNNVRDDTTPSRVGRNSDKDD